MVNISSLMKTSWVNYVIKYRYLPLTTTLGLKFPSTGN